MFHLRLIYFIPCLCLSLMNVVSYGASYQPKRTCWSRWCGGSSRKSASSDEKNLSSAKSDTPPKYRPVKYHGSSNEQLCLAANFGDLKKVKQLLKDGTSTDARDAHDATPLMLAAYGYRRGLDYLSIVQLLLTHKADATAQNEGGTALHSLAYADSAQEVEIATALLDAKTDVTAENFWKETCTDIAVRMKRPKLVALFKQHMKG